ncbi:alkaline phosphatase family protein [Variovorax sp. LjRoot84]|uniref:alkaline phosphatase family protein n=1 Tax=Variovorax sp. LjRoot84 TaxID=3342340 RepID=UPI003ECF76E5
MQTLRLFALALASAFMLATAGPAAAQRTSASAPALAKHALLISIDGAHAIDLALYVKNNPGSHLEQLGQRAITYTNARQPLLGDSTPGLLTLATGGSSAGAGVIYSPFYDRDLSPAGSDCSTRGSVYYVDEKWVKDMKREDSGGGIDPAKLPRDASKGCTPVYPHQLVRVNTMFEVVKAAGRRTAWIDQHEMYNDLLNGPSGKGLDDSRALERKGVPQTLEGFMGQDARRVDLLLNQIRGLESTGTRRVGMPAVFGMGFISFGAVQKSHGYKDGDASPSESLKKTLDFVDESVGRIVGELKSQKRFDSTLIVLTAKHGQSPIDIKQRRVIDRNVIRNAVNSVAPGLLAQASLDAIGLVYLKDRSRTNEVVAALRAKADEAGILKIYAGEQLELLLPARDSRTPDILIQPVLGAFYTDNADGEAAKGLLAEHGGMLDEDTNVPLLVSFPGARPTVNRAPVQVSQVAPTVLAALGLDPKALRAVQAEGTPLLPGFGSRR